MAGRQDIAATRRMRADIHHFVGDGSPTCSLSPSMATRRVPPANVHRLGRASAARRSGRMFA